MDQPQRAIEAYQAGLKAFPDETALMVGVARIHEGIGDMGAAADEYRRVLQLDR